MVNEPKTNNINEKNNKDRVRVRTKSLINNKEEEKLPESKIDLEKIFKKQMSDSKIPD